MKVLLLGGSGLLGSALRAGAPPDVTIDAPPHAVLDATDSAALERALAASNPDWVITCAAFTAVDAAEEREAESVVRRVNVDAVGTLGRLAKAHGARVLFPSTDYVFGGPRTTPWRETDAPAPESVYARSKRDGELALQASGARTLIVRTGWLYGRTGRNFPKMMWSRAHERTPSRVVNDQVGTPTSAADLADWCWQMIARDASGVIHAANAGATTWSDVAQHIYSRAGFPGGVTPVSSAEYGAAAPRPAYSVLDCSALDALLGTQPDAQSHAQPHTRPHTPPHTPPHTLSARPAPHRRPWDVALDAYLDELRAQGVA